jgi:hypothetical protein
MSQFITQDPSGVLFSSSNNSAFGANFLASRANSVARNRLSFSGPTAALADGSSNSRHDENFVLDVAGSENLFTAVASVPASTASGATQTKIAIQGVTNTAAISNFGGSIIYVATGVAGVGQSTGATTQGYVVGVNGSGVVGTGTDATAVGLQAGIVNVAGTAVSTVGTALSKYAAQLQSAGAAKNTAFLYAAKGASGAVPAVNCSHGLLVDSASCDANAFAVVSGTTPTVVYGIQPSGKTTFSAADQVLATQAAAAALTSAAGLITITALTLAGASSVVVACTTAAGLGVTAASRIELVPQNQTGAVAGFVVACADGVTANAFGIRLTNTSAATTYGGGAFSVFYRILN